MTHTHTDTHTNVLPALSAFAYTVVYKGELALETDSLQEARGYCEQDGNYGAVIQYNTTALGAESIGRALIKAVTGHRKNMPVYYNGIIPVLVGGVCGEDGCIVDGVAVVYRGTVSNKLNTVSLV